MFADSSIHYDHATWKMYTRIVSARQLRATLPNHHYMKPRSNCIPLAQEHANSQHLEAIAHLRVNLNRQYPTDEESNFGVFALEM